MNGPAKSLGKPFAPAKIRHVANKQTLVVPDVGFEDHPVALGHWLVEVGEPFRVGDRLGDVTCPGVLVPLTAPESGRLTEVLAHPGEKVVSGQPLARFQVDEALLGGLRGIPVRTLPSGQLSLRLAIDRLSPRIGSPEKSGVL